MLADVPGWRGLPLSRRLRARALGLLAERLEGRGTEARAARDAVPPWVRGAVRRALAPVALPSAGPTLSRAALPDARVRRAPGPPRATVIVPTRGADTLPQCLAALDAHTAVPHERLVIADGCDVAGADLPLAQRRGFAGACNAGAARATAPVLVFLNDDAAVTPGWLERLLDALSRDRAGLAGPASNATGDAATEPCAYGSWPSLLAHARTRDGLPTVSVDKLSLFCAAIDRDLFDAVGGLDEGYGLGGFEDDELCMAVRRRGRAVRLVRSAWVHHHGSVSFGRMPARERIARFEINRHRFERRWGVRWRAPAVPPPG